MKDLNLKELITYHLNFKLLHYKELKSSYNMANPIHMHKRAAALFCLITSSQEDGIWLGFIQQQELDYLLSFNLNTIMVWECIWCFTISPHSLKVLYHLLQNSNDVDHLCWYLKWYLNVYGESKNEDQEAGISR